MSEPQPETLEALEALEAFDRGEIAELKILLLQAAQALEHRLDYRLTDDQESEDRKFIAKLLRKAG